MGVIVADLDYFKRVNDTYGYPVGDAVLQEAGRRMRLAQYAVVLRDPDDC
jgi:two-component system cell cycle response regulator